MRSISKTFQKRASGRNVLICIAVLILFFGVSLPILHILAPEYMGLPSLDSTTVYSPAEIFSIVENWGPDGRVWEAVFHLTWDLFLPVCAIILFGLTISWLTKKCFPENSKLQRLNLLALLYSFDLLENISIEILAISYPAQFYWVAQLKSILTISKYIAGFLIILVIIVLFMQLFIRKLIVKRNAI